MPFLALLGGPFGAVLKIIWKPLAIGLSALLAYGYVHHQGVKAERLRWEKAQAEARNRALEDQRRATVEVIKEAEANEAAAAADRQRLQGEVKSYAEAIRAAGATCKLDAATRERLLRVK